MADEIRYTADASQAFDVIARLQAQVATLDARLGTTGRGGDQIGEAFLRSERIVSRSAANMVTGLISTNDAAQAVAYSLLQFEHASKLGLGLAVGLAVGVAAFEIIHKQLEETRKAREALEKDISKPLALILNLSPADISAQIDRVGKEVEDLRTKSGSISNKIINFVTASGHPDFTGAKTGKLAPQPVEKPDQNEVEISKGEDRLKALADARADAELRIVTQKGHQVTLGAEQAAIEKATNDYLAARSKLFDGAFKPGASQVDLFKQLAALSGTLRQTQDAAREKGESSDAELGTSRGIARFRGNADDKKDFALQSLFNQDLKLLAIAAHHNDIDEIKKRSLKLDQDALALADRKVEKVRQEAAAASEFRIGGIQVNAARANVGLGPEGSQRNDLKAAVEIAQERIKAADAVLDREGKTTANIQAQTKAINEEQIALARRAKFENETAFKNSQELKSAKAGTQEASLQSQGQNFQAAILKAREAAEQRIATLLRNQNGELAGQVAATAKIGIVKQLGDRLAETPQEQIARENAEREQQRRTAGAQAAIADAADREARGARLDENNPVTQALRAQQAIDQGQGAQDQQDFSSVASLAGQDFSSLASLGSLDFSGIASLANLQISIA